MNMIKPLIFTSLLLFAFFTNTVQAELSATDKQHIANLKKGSLKQLKRTAKLIVRTRVINQRVLDTAMEILLQVYPKSYAGQIETLSFLARGIGQSGNGRYYTAMKEVKDQAEFKKLRKYAKKALKMIDKAEGRQYKKGSIKLKTTEYH